jgi:cytochrome c
MKYFIAVALALSILPAYAGADLASSKNCMACHAVERKLVGPSFKDIAARYTERDLPHMTTVIQRGGSGRWGPIPMPGNASITPEEANSLARWVLEQR